MRPDRLPADIANWKGAWATSTNYIANDAVSNDGGSYICTLAHTSAAGSEPGTGGSWATYWDLMADKGSDGVAGQLVGSGAWTTATGYTADVDVVENDGSGYVCKATHTSGALDDEPGVGAVWETYWELLVSKGADSTVSGPSGPTGAGVTGAAGAASTVSGPSGPTGAGATGPTGPTGAAGPLGSTYTTIISSVTQKIVDHNLGQYPAVVVLDASDIEIECQVTHNTVNQCTLDFSEAISGRVICVGGGPSGPTGAASTVSGPSGPSGPTGPIDISGTPVANDYSQFTDADTVRGREYAEVLADIFSVALPENVTIQLDPTLSADTKWSGITEDGTAGTTGLVFGYCYYLASTGKWELTKADAVATSINKLGMCVGAANADATGKLLLYGKIRADDEFPTFTVGAPVFLSAATAGILSSTAPTGTTDFVVRIIGQATTADSLFFKGSDAYATLV